MARRFSKIISNSNHAIKKYEIFKVAPHWQFLRLETHSGVVGWGEPTIEGFSGSVSAAIDELMPNVIDQDATKVEYIWQKLYRQKFWATTGGPILMTAISGIDQALWDISAKICNVPINVMFGGPVRDKCLVYGWCGGDDSDGDFASKDAKRVLNNTNFKMLKMNASSKMGYIDTDYAIKNAIERFRKIREEVGYDIHIGLDFHGRVKIPSVRKLIAGLKPYEPFFVEEPFSIQQISQFKHILSNIDTPIATGERLYTMTQFRDLLEQKCVSIIQPDVSHCGGISNLYNIAKLGECYEVGLAPHCPYGPIALAASLQVDSCAINFAFQETSIGIHYNSEYRNSDEHFELLDYVENKSVFDVDETGHIKTLDAPGLGVTINEEFVRDIHKRQLHGYHERDWVLKDGCPTTN